VFMFLIGLELDPKILKGRAHTSIVISHTSIVVPFGLGALLARYLYPQISSPSVPFSSFVLFMGISMSITAFPVLARILTERRLLQSKVGALTITCAAVDDVTAWCLLAFVVSMVRATHIMGAVRTTLLAVAFVVAMVVLVRPFLRRLGARSETKEGITQNVIAMTLLMLLASAWTTELIGIHALFGAFMFGAIMPKEGGFAAYLAEKLEDFVVVFMLPLFFAYSGLRTQIGLLDSLHAWFLCGLVTIVAVVGKFGGSTVAARLTGMRWREASALGILMNTRGLMELIVLNIGFDLGVISPTLFTMLVLMALATTFMTTPLLEWVFPSSELAKELAKELARAAETPSIITRLEAFTVLVCVSYERSGPALVTLAGALVGKDKQKSRLYALRLIRPTERSSYRHIEEQDGAHGLSPLMDRARELEMPIRTISFVSPRPGHDICNVADVKRADLILLGWHKPLFSRTVLGGTVYEVMEQAKSDVGVLIDRGFRKVQRVLVPFQGTPDDRAALLLARRFLQASGTEVTILHVVRPSRDQGAPSQADQILAQTFAEDGPGGNAAVTMKVVEHQTPADAVVTEAANGYDLVLIGMGQGWGLAQRRFGLTSEAIVQNCPCSLLVVRQSEAERSHAGAGSARVAAERSLETNAPVLAESGRIAEEP
jgi:Kef-type K+ transport system membrane component KefB